ncbi:Mitochondrial substrate/solute carrier [Akanthomyces lecanii RCEF 1005]|uniref:Mitochondrial substrate/solute carrier n=1 Tax=Akanthomyces lecanii RCEF 1005 TaxID=1081108 RepID=A0A168IQL3_CORDF|nr:Mitochondrial substrate/solute carrier [Akanthomyces lecanii RCEF 1005]
MSSAQESAPKPSGKKKAASPAIRYPFWFGGSASSMAACVTHPLDLVKVRIAKPFLLRLDSHTSTCD